MKIVRLVPRPGSPLAKWAGWEGKATRASDGDLDHWMVQWVVFPSGAGADIPARVAQADLSFRIRKFSKRFA